MAEINTQSILFTSSGLLSAQSGPLNVAVPNAPGSSAGGNTDQPTMRKKIRIQGIKVLKTGASGSAEVFDSATASPAPKDSVYESDVNDVVTNLGVNIKSGDIFVNITGGFKVWLYLDLNS